jgi:hypothetical protein
MNERSRCYGRLRKGIWGVGVSSTTTTSSQTCCGLCRYMSPSFSQPQFHQSHPVWQGSTRLTRQPRKRCQSSFPTAVAIHLSQALGVRTRLQERSPRHRGKAQVRPHLQDSAQWFKIRNRKYSQWACRENFFEREQEIHP